MYFLYNDTACGCLCEEGESHKGGSSLSTYEMKKLLSIQDAEITSTWGVNLGGKSMQSFRISSPTAMSRIKLVLVALVLVASSSPRVVWAAIDVNEIDLHDGQTVYGLEAPGTPIPYLNLEAIRLWAWGSDDPNYTDASFYAYGLYGDDNLVNSGVIDVNAVGGFSAAAGMVMADVSVHAAGIYAPSADANNTGPITIFAKGGTAHITGSGTVQAQASGEAHGIRSYHDVYSGADMTISVEGGIASATSGDNPEAHTDAEAHGVYECLTDLTNTHAISVIAMGGTSQANGGQALASANAEAHGLFSKWTGGLVNHVNNSGQLTVIATGGTATVNGDANDYGVNKAYAQADARGLHVFGSASGVATLANSGSVAVTATGGTADANNPAAFTDTQATAEGLYGSIATVDNSGDVAVTAHGGLLLNRGTYINGGFSNATAKGLGVHKSDLTNSGTLVVAAEGGTGGDNTGSSSYGIFAIESTIDNSGAISVTSTGGIAQFLDERIYANALNYVDAVGILGEQSQVSNTGAIVSTATGGSADSGHAGWTDGDATARGISAYSVDYDPTDDVEPDRNNHVDNGGTIIATALGGTADANDDDASANSTAYGLSVQYGDADNDGVIHATALAGSADVNGVGTAQANGKAYGISVVSGGLGNHGVIDANAVGGTARALQDTAEANAYAYGLYDDANSVANTGAVVAAAAGGTAQSSGDNAQADAEAVGIDAVTVYNTGALDLNVDGGWAYAYGTANANASGTGIVAQGQVDNAGDISVDAMAFYAVPQTDGGQGCAQARASGIDAVYDVNNTGSIDVTATGGIAADAIRIEHWPTTMYSRGDAVDIIAAGDVKIPGSWILPFRSLGSGTFTSANADASAVGIRTAGDVNNVGALTVAAIGSYYSYADAIEEATATSSATGIYSEGQTENMGSLFVTANGGTATATDGNADAFGLAYGIDATGSVDNIGPVAVVATGGTATADFVVDPDPNDPWPSTYSIPGGMADSHAAAFGIVSDSNVSGTADITVLAVGGIAEGTYFAQANAFGYGIDATGDVNNTGGMTVLARSLSENPFIG